MRARRQPVRSSIYTSPISAYRLFQAMRVGGNAMQCNAMQFKSADTIASSFANNVSLTMRSVANNLSRKNQRLQYVPVSNANRYNERGQTSSLVQRSGSLLNAAYSKQAENYCLKWVVCREWVANQFVINNHVIAQDVPKIQPPNTSVA